MSVGLIGQVPHGDKARWIRPSLLSIPWRVVFLAVGETQTIPTKCHIQSALLGTPPLWERAQRRYLRQPGKKNKHNKKGNKVTLHLSLTSQYF